MYALMALLGAFTATASLPLYQAYPLRADAQGVIRVDSQATGDGSLFDAIAEAAQTHTYAQTLDFIQTREPRLLRNHVLIHHSQSLQAASQERPRVVLFDQGTLLALSEPAGREAREIEMLGWDPVHREFRAAELRFANPAARGTVQRDPVECAGCHGGDFRPIWLPYDFWPGVYGANISRTFSAREEQALESFMASARQAPPHSIYARLDFSLTAPSSSLGRYQLQAVEIFTELLSQLNVLSLYPRIPPAAHPALAAIGGQCFASQVRAIDEAGWIRRWQEFAPQAPLTLSDFAQHRERRDRHKQQLLARYEADFGPAGERTYQPERLRKEYAFPVFREKIAELVGWDSRLLGLSPFELAGIQTSPLSGELLWTSLLSTDPSWGDARWVRSIYQPAGIPRGLLDWSTVDCDQLARESRVRLDRWSGADHRVKLPPVAQCADCHTINRGAAPYIPFDEPFRLKAWLPKIRERLHHAGPGQMPPGGWDEDETRILEDTLTRIQHL